MAAARHKCIAGLPALRDNMVSQTLAEAFLRIIHVMYCTPGKPPAAVLQALSNTGVPKGSGSIRRASADTRSTRLTDVGAR